MCGRGGAPLGLSFPTGKMTRVNSCCVCLQGAWQSLIPHRCTPGGDSVSCC